MDDLKQFTRRLSEPRSTRLPEGPVENDVGRCGHWDTDLDSHGYCRDQDCRRARLLKALHTGQAFRLKDGTLFWMVE